MAMDTWCRRALAAAAGALLVAMTAEAALAVDTAGYVLDAAGSGVSGAMITVTDTALRRGTTVYTDDRGWFQFPELPPGVYDLRVRRAGYRDLLQPAIALPRPALSLELDAESDPHVRAWQLPASRWLPLLLARLPSDAQREEFLRQCAFCHQQGSWATRVPRPVEDWDKILTLMGRMGGIVSADLRHALPAAFNAAYDPETAAAALGSAPVAALDPAARTAVITEWELGEAASTQHDLAVHPDGTIYSVDTSQDKLYRLDPRSSRRWVYDIPRGDSPLGGVIGLLAAPNSNAHVAPHSLQVAPDGAIWVTLCLGNKIGRFDPRSEQWQIIEQEDGLYPHTLRFDGQGRLWYTLAVSNHVGMIDPRTGQRGVIRLPARDWQQELMLRLTPYFLSLARYVSPDRLAPSDGVRMPVPYGIDIAPDGGVWFSQLNEHRIGRIDPTTGTIEMVETPFTAPRRMRFDSRGNLWIAGFSAGVVARYDPRARHFDTWHLPTEGVETPYALNVDRRTDTVWICGTNSDSLIRFEPERERFTVYPLPTRVTYTREIDFDADGGVWTSNSNFPAWQIESAQPRVLRLQP
ncbi:MAG TPA: carboxypeptidase regulatory-like domain-containing protein [Candidatus Dormibacteraeota bacterium]|nr:carboxypeptidase regulatory-like domain-containing protein [Candidatus Dormibacteraeota bacterium]